MHLTGTRRHTVDAKLRLKLPADFRREFGDRVCLLPWQGALYGFTPEGHEAFVQEFFPDGFNPLDRKSVVIHRALHKHTETVDIDSAGRISLGKVPEEAQPLLGEKRQVVVVGNEDHFEIWSEDAWEAEEAKSLAVLGELFDE